MVAPLSDSRLGLANVSIGAAFVLSVVFKPGTWLVELLLEGPVLWEMRGIARQLPLLLGNYWIPATAIYLALRYTGIIANLRLTAWIHWVIVLGNLALLSYVILRLAASTVPGGGVGFVVASIGSFVLVLPGYGLLATGFGALVKEMRVQKKSGEKLRVSLGRAELGAAEGLLVIAAVAVPIADFVWLYAGSTSPFRFAREAQQLMNERCPTAGEKILKPIASAKGLFIERDEGYVLDGVRNGVYSSIGFGSLGRGLIERRVIEYYEVPSIQDRHGFKPTSPYLRFARGDHRGEGIEALASEYAVRWKDIATPKERGLEISAMEVVIEDLRTREPHATARFFVSRTNRRICAIPGHSYGVNQFILRAFGRPQ